MVGDYINRGPGSCAVLNTLVKAREEFGNKLVLLRGNHEVALLEWFKWERSVTFLQHRGTTTIRSYIPAPGPNVLNDFRRLFPEAHLNLLRETVLFAEGPRLLVSHAGYCTDRPCSRSEKDMTLGSWEKLLESTNAPRPLVVVGHYVQPTGRPYISEHLIGIDTGCGTISSAPLTMLQLPERIFHTY